MENARIMQIRRVLEDIEQYALDFEDSAERLDIDLCGLTQIKDIQDEARKGIVLLTSKDD